MTTTVEKSIQVDAPISAVYNQWTQFEEFPQFMGGVTEVTQLDDRRLHWVAEIAGVKREWDAEILQQVPEQTVSWAAVQGATNAGTVSFQAVGPIKTQVTLHLEYEPEGVVEAVGDRLNIVEKQAQSDLEKFKEFIEARGSATGGWRGSVNEDLPAGQVGVEAAAGSQGDSGKAGVSGKAVAAGAAVAAGVAAVAAATAAKKSGGEDTEVETAPVGGAPITPPVVSTTPDIVPAAEVPVVPVDAPVAGADDVLEPVTVVPPNDPRPDTSDPETGVPETPNR
jgi:hypothetical protein